MARTALLFGSLVVALASSIYAGTTDDVIALTQKGASVEVITAFIGASLKLPVSDVIKLLEAKVPDKVIISVLLHQPRGPQDEQKDTAAARADETPAGNQGPVKQFALKDGRVLVVVNSVDSEEEYVVKTDKGKVLKLQKSDVLSITEIEPQPGDNRAVAERRPQVARAAQREPAAEPPAKMVVYNTPPPAPQENPPASAYSVSGSSESFPGLYGNSGYTVVIPQPYFYLHSCWHHWHMGSYFNWYNGHAVSSQNYPSSTRSQPGYSHNSNWGSIHHGH
ncbi:MAG: hypothetical protein ABSE73_22190 [Planctomycetota bacterium]